MDIDKFNDIPDLWIEINGVNTENVAYRTTGGDATLVNELTSNPNPDDPQPLVNTFVSKEGDEGNTGVRHDPSNSAYNIGLLPSFQMTQGNAEDQSFIHDFGGDDQADTEATVFFVAELDSVQSARVFDSDTGFGSKHFAWYIGASTEGAYVNNSIIGNAGWPPEADKPMFRCLQSRRGTGSEVRMIKPEDPEVGDNYDVHISSKNFTQKLRTLSLFCQVDDNVPVDGRVGIFLWYARYLTDTEIISVFELMEKFVAEGGGPVEPELPTEHTFGPIQPSDPTADVTWEISRDAHESTDDYVDAPTNMSDAEVTTDPVTKESTLHVKSVVANDAGLIRGKADAGYGAILTGPARLNVEVGE